MLSRAPSTEHEVTSDPLLSSTSLVEFQAKEETGTMEDALEDKEHVILDLCLEETVKEAPSL